MGEALVCSEWWFRGIGEALAIQSGGLGIPTPVEGEGGGQNQAVEFHFFCLETLG